MELQRIKLLEDRSQYPRVRVVMSTGGKNLICLHINERGCAVCVDHYSEDDFLRGDDLFNTGAWLQWEEIKEPTYRPYRAEEDISHLLGAKVRHIKEKEVSFIITGVDPRKNKSMFYCNGLWHPPIGFYKNYEHLDGTPIGVKE
jgi:hypothetical protein